MTSPDSITIIKAALDRMPDSPVTKALSVAVKYIEQVKCLCKHEHVCEKGHVLKSIAEILARASESGGGDGK